MQTLRTAIAACSALAIAFHAHAVGPDFSGTWELDLRSAPEKLKNADCGTASFVLLQSGDRITGDHVMATTGCGRVNEGGEGTVKGVVMGSRAVLVVTSGRNGAVVMGTATLRGAQLEWKVLEEIKDGEPKGDSPLILSRGLLARASSKSK